MTPRTLLLHLALPALCTAAPAQSEPRTEAVIEGHFDAFTTDELGHVYALRGDELVLFDPRGESWLRNSVKTFGRIAVLDAFYSLKPLLFSAEQGQLAMLDNTLSLQGSVINLPRSGFPQVVLACASVQNHFWFFDQREGELIRVDAQLRPVASTGRIDQLIGHTPEPVQMQELDNWLYVNSPRHGILVFDLFGTYARTIPLQGVERFEVRHRSLYLVRKGRFERCDLPVGEAVPLPLPPLRAGEVLRDARVEQGRMMLLLADRIVIARLPAP
ncbi:MAG: hypothetical protein IT228_10805 [Flavobacteriales bacterium]|nr:hypothetical protein [Flavobacteriales bacterium]MCC6577820.1 hypothetical protein [Flavobacteriales bacterium]NUQ15285.1 hypothetical protein [Flavobacteriales bacterium]